MQEKNLPILKIHKLTQSQYDRELDSGNIDENALYLTPDEDYLSELIQEVQMLKSEIAELKYTINNLNK